MRGHTSLQTARTIDSLDRFRHISHHHVTQASEKGLGSGVLIDDQGSIITNAHVVDGAANA
ncbi:MAG: hypothetical protein P0120_19445 [Nitrospira sp.]|nr:hypothetical protein [Nitrospira sp.]